MIAGVTPLTDGLTVVDVVGVAVADAELIVVKVATAVDGGCDAVVTVVAIITALLTLL